MKNHNNVSHYLALCVSLISLVMALVSGVMFLGSLDKTNAVQEAQISNLTKSFERLENKVDQSLDKKGCACVSFVKKAASYV